MTPGDMPVSEELYLEIVIQNKARVSKPYHDEKINMSRRIEFMTICIWRYIELFTLVQSKGSVLHVSTDVMDTVWSQFGHR